MSISFLRINRFLRNRLWHAKHFFRQFAWERSAI
jgi:hypothetical protein